LRRCFFCEGTFPVPIFLPRVPYPGRKKHGGNESCSRRVGGGGALMSCVVQRAVDNLTPVAPCISERGFAIANFRPPPPLPRINRTILNLKVTPWNAIDGTEGWWRYSPYAIHPGPLPQHTFLFLYLCFLPDAGRMNRPKHAVGTEPTHFKCCVWLDWKRYFLQQFFFFNFENLISGWFSWSKSCSLFTNYVIGIF